MKSLYLNKLLIVLAVLMSTTVFSQNIETVTMNAGYTDDVYFSLDNGEITRVDRTNWDIAFYANVYTAGIITNDGNSIVLKTYPNGDISSWDNVDTTGYSSWTEMYNDETDWENGAFNRNQTGHPDYGWGTLSMVDFNITGDSLFLIQLPDGVVKKLKIDKKYSSLDKYEFTYANIDGSDEYAVELDLKPFEEDNFYYYSLTNNQAIDREPAGNTWDLLFTKYHAVGIPMPVTGVFSNVNTGVAKYEHVTPDFVNWNMNDLDSTKNVIGYNWKSFNMSTFSYTINDSIVYFVQSTEGNIYKIHFTSFEGASTGNIEFTSELISLNDIGDFNIDDEEFVLFPNPTSNNVNINGDFQNKTDVTIYNITGQRVYYNTVQNCNTTSIPVSDFNSGIYFVRITRGNWFRTLKLNVE